MIIVPTSRLLLRRRHRTGSVEPSTSSTHNHAKCEPTDNCGFYGWTRPALCVATELRVVRPQVCAFFARSGESRHHPGEGTTEDRQRGGRNPAIRQRGSAGGEVAQAFPRMPAVRRYSVAGSTWNWGGSASAASAADRCSGRARNASIENGPLSLWRRFAAPAHPWRWPYWQTTHRRETQVSWEETLAEALAPTGRRFSETISRLGCCPR